ASGFCVRRCGDKRIARQDTTSEEEERMRAGLRWLRWGGGLALAAMMVSGAMLGTNTASAAQKFKVYLSMSYIGNDWQAEAQRMISAMAASKEYRDKVDLKIQVAGPDA